MSKSTGNAMRGALGAALCVAFSAAPLSAAAAPGTESPRIPFTQRYQAVHHGGIVRAANSAITCLSPKSPSVASCSAVRGGAAGANGDFDMLYVDEDDDPNTYNSSRAALTLPANSRVKYARLYWGGNLRVGEQKPPKDNGRVLIAEPGGRYKEVLADTRVAHRDADGSDAYQASADVTPLVRRSGSGLYTVSQINVAKGHSKVGVLGRLVAGRRVREQCGAAAEHLAVGRLRNDERRSLTSGDRAHRASHSRACEWPRGNRGV